MYGGLDEFRFNQRERIRGLARERFFAFYRLMFPVLAPEAVFSGAQHFQVLANMLERVANGEVRRLLIAIPPRHGKSLFTSVAFPAWLHGRDPTRKIICASYGDQLSRDFSNRYRDLMWSNAYQAVFPDSVIAPNGASLHEVRLLQKGYRLGTTVQGAATGKGAHFIIVDDPFKASEAASDAVRNAVYDWFKSTLMTRFDNPAEGAVIIVMQRLHQDDLIGRLRDEGGWEYLAMPGEFFEKAVYDLGDGRKWTVGPGDLLYPERFNRAALDQLQYDLGEAAYNAQILQRPSPPRGMLIKLKHFQRYETPPTHYEAIVQSWDPAVVDTETAAFSVCTTWGILGRKLYLIDVLRKRLDFHKIEPAILHMKEKYNAGCVLLETAGVGAAIGIALKKRADASRWLCPYDPTLGKVERAIAQTPKIERKRVYLPVSAPWLETFEAEVSSFPLTKYYDQVDSMVQFLYLLDHRNRWTMNLTAVREHREQPF